MQTQTDCQTDRKLGVGTVSDVGGVLNGLGGWGCSLDARMCFLVVFDANARLHGRRLACAKDLCLCVCVRNVVECVRLTAALSHVGPSCMYSSEPGEGAERTGQ